MKLYRFSPITSKQSVEEVLEYLAVKTRELSSMFIEEKLPINTLKIFAHYKNEHAFLKEWIDEQGEFDEESSDSSYYVKPAKPLKIVGESIEYLGIRAPDPYRMQVGCGDFVVKNFDELKTKYLGTSEFIREVQHPLYEMLELFHPDFDILGYIVKG